MRQYFQEQIDQATDDIFYLYMVEETVDTNNDVGLRITKLRLDELNTLQDRPFIRMSGCMPVFKAI